MRIARTTLTQLVGRLATVSAALALVGAIVFGASTVEAQRRRRRPPTPAQVEQARTRFTSGTAHYSAGRLNEALADFRAAWELMPRPDLAYNVARTYERMGDVDHGIEFYGHYLRHAAPDAAARSEVEERIAALRALQRRQREQVFTAPPSEDAVTAEARTFFERGVVMFRRRRYEAAMLAFTAAYGFARLPEVIYNMAITSERLNHTQDAIDYYREYARSLPADSAERAVIDREVARLRR